MYNVWFTIPCQNPILYIYGGEFELNSPPTYASHIELSCKLMKDTKRVKSSQRFILRAIIVCLENSRPNNAHLAMALHVPFGILFDPVFLLSSPSFSVSKKDHSLTFYIFSKIIILIHLNFTLINFIFYNQTSLYIYLLYYLIFKEINYSCKI